MITAYRVSQKENIGFIIPYRILFFMQKHIYDIFRSILKYTVSEELFENDGENNSIG